MPDPVSSMGNFHHPTENVFNHDCVNLEELHPELHAVNNGQHPAGEPSLIHECKDPSRLMVECETPLRAVESSLDVQFTENGCDIFEETGTDFFDDEKMETRTLANPTSFQPEYFFNEENDW
jgi:hypothetical protein